MPRIVLSLSSRDSAVLEEVKASFPSLNFKLKSLKCGCVQLRLSNLRDISCFIKEVKPYLRVFTNVRRAEILEEIVDFILERLHGRHYGSRENFKPLLSRIAEMRRYSKRGMGAKHYDISALIGEKVEGKDVSALIEESKQYTPRDFDDEYIAGLFDAEGYVGLCLHRHPKAAFGYYMQPVVGINLAIYDAGVLFKLKERFARLNPIIKIRESNNTAYFQISSLNRVEEFIKTIYPLSRLPTMKQRLSLVLEAINIIKETSLYTEDTWSKLTRIREELKAYAKRRMKE